jgi:ATP/ADP translocase
MEKSDWYYRILNIKKDELKAVFLLMVFSFFVGLSLSFYFTAANAIFLKHFPSKIISVSYMASGVAVYLAWLVLSKIDNKVSLTRQLALKFIFVFVSVLLISLWVWIFDSPASAFIMFTWIRVVVYITLVTFWGMAGKLFNIRQGKRVFGLIGIGEVISILIGYFSIPLILKVLKAKDLLFLSSGGLFICLIFTLIILNIFHNRLTDAGVAKKTDVQPSKPKDASYFKLLKKPYFRFISIMAFLPIFGYLFIDFLFLDQTKHEFANNPEMISGFLGLFLGFTAFIELLFKLISGRFLNRYGMKPSLMALPAILLFSIVLATFFGTLYGTLGLFFALIAFARLFERAVRGSIYEPAFQLLYQPVQEDQRLVFQNQIEGIPKALGTILTGGIIFLLSSIKIFNLVHFNYFFIIVLGIWIWVAIKMYQEYRTTIQAKLAGMRQSAVQHEVSKESITPRPEAQKIYLNNFDELSLMAASPHTDVRLNAAIQLGFTSRYNAFKLLQTLLNDPEPIVKKAAIISSGYVRRFELWSSIIDNISSPTFGNTAAIASISIGETILPEIDRHFARLEENKEASLKVLKVYREVGGDIAIKYLRRKIEHPDKDIRFNVLLSLSELEYQASTAEIPIIKQTIDEMAEALVWCLASWFDVETYEGQNDLQKALNQEIIEKKESIFLLLSLIFDGRTIRYIRENIEGSDSRARMYALEVCDMTVSADIKDLIMSLFDEVGPKEKLERFVSRYPQEVYELRERLIDVVNKEYGIINKWTKACAIEMLKVIKEDEDNRVRQLLLANIVNPDYLISETAFNEFKRRYPDLNTRNLGGENGHENEYLQRLFSNFHTTSISTLSVLEKVKLLKEQQLFASFAEQSLCGFAMQWVDKDVKTSDHFFLRIPDGNLLGIHKEDLKEFLLGFNLIKSDEEIVDLLKKNA